MAFLKNFIKYFKKPLHTPPSKNISFAPTTTPIVITSKDIKAVSGEDVMATQLDLARAYLEMGKKKLSKQILEHVIQNGNESQQQEAQKLLIKSI